MGKEVERVEGVPPVGGEREIEGERVALGHLDCRSVKEGEEDRVTAGEGVERVEREGVVRPVPLIVGRVEGDTLTLCVGLMVSVKDTHLIPPSHAVLPMHTGAVNKRVHPTPPPTPLPPPLGGHHDVPAEALP